MRIRDFWPLLALALLIAPPAAAGELAGVTMDDSIAIGGRSLALQGMGLRTKWRIKIYVGGLYLTAPTTDAAAIVSSTEPKVVDMAMVRALAADKITGGIEAGFEANNDDATMATLRERLDRMMAMFPAVKAGDVARLAWTPGHGTVVSMNGEQLGVIEGQDFADALFSCWLGETPAQESLKSGMLGLD
jgi:hypothetical protein